MVCDYVAHRFAISARKYQELDDVGRVERLQQL